MKISDIPELPACAAIRLNDGTVLAGDRHGNLIATAAKLQDSRIMDDQQGFMTNRGRFVRRMPARGLLERHQYEPKGGTFTTFTLLSEDLY